MNFVERITPGFVKRIDHYLLIHYPVLWSYKLHYLLWFQAVSFLVMIGVSYAYPIRLGGIPEVEIPAVVMLVLFGFANLGWIFLTNLHDARTRIAGRPMLHELTRMITYGYAYTVFFTFLFVSLGIMHKRTIDLFPTLSEYKVADETADFFYHFEEQHTWYARGLEMVDGYSDYPGRYDEKSIPIGEERVNAAFRRIAELNVLYGNGKTYSTEELIKATVQSPNGLFYGYSSSGEQGILRPLVSNIRDCRSAHSFFENSFNTRHLYDLLLVFIWVFGLLTTFILYYRYFDIRGVIQGLIAPALAFLVGVALVFIMAQTIDRRLDDFPFDSLCLLVAAAIGIGVLRKNWTSNRRIMIYQTIPILLFVAALFFDEEHARTIHNYYKDRDWTFEHYKTVHLLGLTTFIFLIVPLYHFGLYRLFYLPKK